MKHPCAGCKAKGYRGRVTCPILWREIAFESCGRMHKRTPKEALVYFETHKEVK